jgi:DNA-binding NarL/FixJ family response regulator
MTIDGSVRVLVAANHRIVRGVIDLACRDAGVSVVDRVETAAVASIAIRTIRPDILVLDVDLPDQDGLRMLGELEEGQRPPGVVVLADRADGDLILRALQLGVRAFLRKADGLRELAGAIRKVAAGERAIDPRFDEAAIAALGGLARRAREGVDMADDLTPREQEVLSMLSRGLTIRQVGSRLGISPRTVETHVGKLYRKLGVRTRLHAVSVAAELGLVDLVTGPALAEARER